MSRNEGKIGTEDRTPVDDELRAEIESEVATQVRRQDAIACYLSGSDGWKEAFAALGGAFAPPAPHDEVNRE